MISVPRCPDQQVSSGGTAQRKDVHRQDGAIPEDHPVAHEHEGDAEQDAQQVRDEEDRSRDVRSEPVPTRPDTSKSLGLLDRLLAWDGKGLASRVHQTRSFVSFALRRSANSSSTRRCPSKSPVEARALRREEKTCSSPGKS